MPAMSAPPTVSIHLRAAGLALLTAGAILGAGVLFALHLEHRYIHGIAPEMFPLKNQGVALQKAAFEQRDLLPLYGSSELVKHIPDKASNFFRRYPTDFSVFPVGKAGTTPLIILQKLAALGPAVRGHKVAISLSPSWFFIEQIDAHYYDGNFSALQATEFVFGNAISEELKREAATRMLAFPESLAKRPLLGFALRHLANGAWQDRCAVLLLRLVAPIDHAVACAQDHFESAYYILQRHFRRAMPPRRPMEIDWPHLLQRAAQFATPYGGDPNAGDADWTENSGGGDEQFLKKLAQAHEWKNLELLLRGMRELGLQPLLLSMPLNGVQFDRLGISPSSREAYYERLRGLAEQYQMPLIDFQDHEKDPKFFADAHDHLSTEGWMYYDEALDDFFHDRHPLAGLSAPGHR
jgi:D-alanine transfer protein